MLRMPDLPFLRPKKQPLIGLDITSSAVKLLELHPQGNGMKVASYGVAPIEVGAVSDRRIKDYKSVARSIQRVVERTKPSTLNAAIAVPTGVVITRTLVLPRHLDDDEMEAWVLQEADQHIPYPLNEVAVDFERQPPVNPDDESQPVLLVACRKETTNQLDQLLLDAGLKPSVIDVENFATERALRLIVSQLPGYHPGHIVAVADIGANVTTLDVLKDGKIIYSRDQIFGGKQLTDEIQRYYGLSREEAGLAKKRGNLPADYISEILEPFKKAAVQQIQRQLQLFYSSSAHHEIDYLILAGGSSAIEGLQQLANHQIGAPSAVANPFSNMAISDKVKAAALAQDAPAMMIACGLAMRGMT